MGCTAAEETKKRTSAFVDFGIPQKSSSGPSLVERGRMHRDRTASIWVRGVEVVIARMFSVGGLTRITELLPMSETTRWDSKYRHSMRFGGSITLITI